MTAVIYARYSSDNQREESIEGQLRECSAFAEKNDITILRSYIDRAYSAKTDNRPAFQEMIADSSKHMFDAVIVWKLDRFARNRYDSARYKASLKKNGVKVISATETISDGSEGILLESVLEGFAEYYSADLSEKVIRGMTENALKCKFNGGTIPFGYTIDSERHFQPDPVTSPYVLEVFKRYDEGATMTEIKNWLNDKGLTNTLGGAFTFHSVQTMLKNRRYIGEFKFRDTIVPDGIPPLVPLDLFERVQEKVTKNKKAPARKKAEEEYLLTTKLFCGYCGEYMCGESGTSRHKVVYHYYKCVNTKKRKTCKKKPVQKHWLEDLVVNEIMKVVMDDQTIDALVSMLMNLQEQENTDLPRYEKQLAETERAIGHMLDAIQQGIFTRATKERLDELEHTKEDMEVKIANEKIAKPTISQDQLYYYLRQFRELDVSNVKHRKTLIDTFVNAIYLYDDHLRIVFNFQNGESSITFEEIQSAEEELGSDITSSAVPRGYKSIPLLYPLVN